ncbi:MAG TPA: hypothetical protein VG079_07525 [Gaiellaceae bacterium]|nr:hypothetical protein [Gaiellaceae bacterium]
MRRFSLLLAGCLGVAVLSLVLPSSPTYDPWAWLVWGREITELDLDTRYGPSWKPFPVLFTTVFAVFGDAAPPLWLVVARAGAILAVVMTYRLASRLAGGGRVGVLAGAAAAFGLVFTEGWIRHGALGNSEGLLVAFVLLAIDRHLDGSRGQALAAAFGAALLRPEVWPFLGLYAVFLWLKEPRLRALAAASVLVLPILWFVPDLVATGELLRSSERAQDPTPGSPAFADRPAFEVASRAVSIPPVAVVAAFAAALALGVLTWRANRRFPPILALALGVVAFVGLVALMTEAGYSGNLRYLLLPAALMAVAGAATIGELARRAGGRQAVAVGALAAAALGASAALHVGLIRTDLDEVTYEGRLYHDLGRAVSAADGAGVADCGRPVTGPFHVPALAWHLRVHTGTVGLEPEAEAIVFRAPTRPGTGAAPPKSALANVPAVARAGEWEVFATCPLPED